MPQRNRHQGKRHRLRTRLLSAAGLALIGHTLLLGGIVRLITRDALDPGLAVDPMEISQLADVLMPPLPPLDDGMVIQAVGDPAPAPPEATPHVAEQNMDPARETVRRPADEPPRASPAIDLPASPGPVRGPRPEPGAGPSAAASAQAEAADLPRVPDPVAALPVPPLPEPAPPTPREHGASPAPGNGQDAGAPALASGAPPRAAELGLAPGVQPETLLPIDSGDVTAIRARESARARYQNLVRLRVQEVWKAADAYRKASAGGLIDGRPMENLVMLRVAADGTVERADLQLRSGIGPLDQEAVAVFARASPFDRPPGDILDERGGLQFPVRLTVEENVTTFQQQARRTIRDRWRPSPAFSRAGDHERVTVARVLLTAQGVLARAQVISSAGIDFLDQGAMAALAAGLRLPDPPGEYAHVGGLVPLLVEFRHTVKRPPPDVRVLKPNEQPQVR
jgi:outer membrane biosynthesis protein TonB